jgi:hypothetical protein
MASSPSLPAGFSWLLPDFRPTRREVKAYAEAIKAADAGRGRTRGAILKQAELQLWVWRTETRQPPPRRRPGAGSDDGSMVHAMPAF